MKLDLSKYNCESFSFFTEAEISDALFTEIKSLCSKASESTNRIRCSETYEIKSINYSADLLIAKRRQDKFTFHLEYSKRPPSYAAEKESVRNLLALLSKKIDRELVFMSSGSFEYSSKKFVNTFGLPVKMGKTGIFDEIKGIHGYKYENKRLLYDMILDLVEDNYWVALTFFYTGFFSEELPKLILENAYNVSLKAVAEKPKHGKKADKRNR